MAKSGPEVATGWGKLRLDSLKIPASPDHCWVHPKAGILGNPHQLVLTMQQLWLRESDVFSPLYQLLSQDRGKSWSAPELVTALGRRPQEECEVGICDFTPSWHQKTGKVLGIGHTVRYKEEQLSPDPRPRETAYAVFDLANHAWSAWETVAMPRESKFFNSGAGCAQRVDLASGEILLPIYFYDGKTPYRNFTVMRCAFDGEKLRYLEHGSEHVLKRERGFLEPSLVEFQRNYFVTLRAGDGHGYVSSSPDGLDFAAPRPWLWDDGTQLLTGDTQQHWLKLGKELFLVYTRVREDNGHVFRHRAPLLMAKVDPNGPCLIKKSEQVLVPERGARLGNFQVTQISATEAWVTVSEWMQPLGCEKYGSDNAIYLARLSANC
jgi:hypothetical protein